MHLPEYHSRTNQRAECLPTRFSSQQLLASGMGRYRDKISAIIKQPDGRRKKPSSLLPKKFRSFTHHGTNWTQVDEAELALHVDEDEVSYDIMREEPGEGFRHVVTPPEIYSRLADFPSWMLESLDIVLLARITKKERLFPCYGFQQEGVIALFPVPDGPAHSSVEIWTAAPPPSFRTELEMFGVQWERCLNGEWEARWTEQQIHDYYLENIIPHEVAHLIDGRNTRKVDRERFARWFALDQSIRRRSTQKRPAHRRHHAKAIGGSRKKQP